MNIRNQCFCFAQNESASISYFLPSLLGGITRDFFPLHSRQVSGPARSTSFPASFLSRGIHACGRSFSPLPHNTFKFDRGVGTFPWIRPRCPRPCGLGFKNPLDFVEMI